MPKVQLMISLFLVSLISFGQKKSDHGRIQVSNNSYYLQYEDQTPFFWLGDTGWELFHRLTLEEIEQYLNNRSEKGFTVIQAVALAEFDGLTRPNRYGQLPFKDLNSLVPNEEYFKIIDSTIHMARDKHLVLGLLPTWGDKVTLAWGAGPVIFDSIKAYAYGFWLGNRYKNDKNLIWILGGDRPAVQDSNDYRPVWRQMAKGIMDATERQCLITYHPSGGSNSTSQWIQNESWLNINMFQSGHGSGHDVPCWELVQRDRSYLPPKPTLDAEPNYEDHPVNPWPKWNTDNGYFRDYDVRKQTYRSVFAGACGVTYGHHAVWQFMSAREEAINYPDRGWINALDRPGAYQVGYLRKLIESRPFLDRIPDSAIILKGQGFNGEHIEAFRGGNDSYMMIYLPVGKTITVNTASLKSKEIIAWWFNPRAGTAQKIALLKRMDQMSFTPPSSGKAEDWVLVIDLPSANYKEPGN